MSVYSGVKLACLLVFFCFGFVLFFNLDMIFSVSALIVSPFFWTWYSMYIEYKYSIFFFFLRLPSPQQWGHLLVKDRYDLWISFQQDMYLTCVKRYLGHWAFRRSPMRLGTLKGNYMWDVFLLLSWEVAGWVGLGRGVCLSFKFVCVCMCYRVQLIDSFQEEVDTPVFCLLINTVKPGT